MNPHTQTDAERVMELREAADEAQAARLEAVTEIARQTKALRGAEVEREAYRRALHIIGYEPIGDSEASYREVYDAIIEIAREALAVHATPRP